MNDSNTALNALDLPIGLEATGMRRELASLGDVGGPAYRHWGAQAQRGPEHVNIGNNRMPEEVYQAYGYVKKAAAVVNTQAGRLPASKDELSQRVCDEVISGPLDADFPLRVWQTGSDTHYAIDHDLTLKQTAPAKAAAENCLTRSSTPLALTRPGSADDPASPRKA